MIFDLFLLFKVYSLLIYKESLIYFILSCFKRLLSIVLLLLLLSVLLDALELAHDSFSASSADGYSRDDGFRDQLKIKGKKRSYKRYDLGAIYAGASLNIAFQLQWRGGWEDSGFYQDYCSISFNDHEVVHDTFSGSASSWEAYSLAATADANGTLTIDFFADTTAVREYLLVDDLIAID